MQVRRRSAYLLLPLIAAACGGGSGTRDPTPSGLQEVVLEAGGLTRRLLLSVPAASDGATALPLVLVFHGGGENAAVTVPRLQDLLARSEQDRFCVAFMQAFNPLEPFGSGAWDTVFECGIEGDIPFDDIAFARGAVDRVALIVPIARDRVYAFGFSNGGMFCHRLAAEAPDLLRAAACTGAGIGGVPGANEEPITVQPTAPIPMILLHGTEDAKVDIGGGPSSANPDCEYASFREGATLWARNNGCSTQFQRTVIAAREGDVYVDTAQGCGPEARVIALTIVGHRHNWPTLAISGFDGIGAVLDFFLSFE